MPQDIALKPRLNRRRHILEVASRLFASKGYLATGMRELAEHVGIEPASIYSHFASKDDLLWELTSRCASEFLETAEAKVASEPSPAARLQNLIVGHVEVTLRNQNIAQLFISEWKHLSEARLLAFSALRDDYERLFRECLVDGIRVGVFRKGDPKFATLALLSALNFTYQWYRPEGTLTPTEVGERLADTLINGLIKPAQTTIN